MTFWCECQIAQYLRGCGYKVIEAVSADEAMAVLLHRATVVDVVFSDIEMPGSIDGFGLAKNGQYTRASSWSGRSSGWNDTANGGERQETLCRGRYGAKAL